MKQRLARGRACSVSTIWADMGASRERILGPPRADFCVIAAPTG